MPTYAVAGVTGHVGAVVAQTLLDQQRKVGSWSGRRGRASDGASAAQRWRWPTWAMPPTWPRRCAVPRAPSSSFPAASGHHRRARKAKRILDAMVRPSGNGRQARGLPVFAGRSRRRDGDRGPPPDAEQGSAPSRRRSVPPLHLLRGELGPHPARRQGRPPGILLPLEFRHPHVATHDVGRVAAELILEHPKAHRVVGSPDRRRRARPKWRRCSPDFWGRSQTGGRTHRGHHSLHDPARLLTGARRPLPGMHQGISRACRVRACGVGPRGRTGSATLGRCCWAGRQPR